MWSLKTGTKAGLFALLILTVALSWWLASTMGGSEDRPTGFAPLPAQTDVDRAQHLIDGNGVPNLRIEGVGDVRHPAFVALYALQYAGLEINSAEKMAPREPRKFRACVDWLIKNLKQDSNGNWAWEYPFDSTYNDVTIRAPWVSAFGQAVGIEALVASFRIDGRPEHLESARKAAEILFRSLDQGGLLFQRGDDIWFEEIPAPRDNPSHILNGHMRSLLAIKRLAEATGRPEYRVWLRRGLDTLERWLPFFDNGYWLRYDLNPKKSNLLFRLSTPSRGTLPAVAVDYIVLRDPLAHAEVKLDVGALGDSKGETRIAGNDWGPSEILDGRTIRKLKPVKAVDAKEEADGELHPPTAFFYLRLPSKWGDNLQSELFELVLSLKDEFPGILSVQMRSIAPGPAFKTLHAASLQLIGSGHWQQWRVPLRPSDLGWWVGLLYAQKHALYLKELSELRPSLTQWASRARKYETFQSLGDDQDGVRMRAEPPAHEVLAGVRPGGNAHRTSPLRGEVPISEGEGVPARSMSQYFWHPETLVTW